MRYKVSKGLDYHNSFAACLSSHNKGCFETVNSCFDFFDFLLFVAFHLFIVLSRGYFLWMQRSRYLLLHGSISWANC